MTMIYPRGEGFWSSQGCRSLAWRYSFHSENFSFVKDPKVKSLTLKSNLPEGTFSRLHSLDRFSGDGTPMDPRFVVLTTSCLMGQCVSDHRQECFVRRPFLRILMMEVSVHSVLDQTGTTTPCQRFPTKEEFAALQTDGGKLPKNLHFVSPQRFVTSSLVQALGKLTDSYLGLNWRFIRQLF